jgi:hypothetical protein
MGKQIIIGKWTTQDMERINSEGKWTKGETWLEIKW